MYKRKFIIFDAITNINKSIKTYTIDAKIYSITLSKIITSEN